MKKLSFILPVYNVEPYLEKCIRSVTDKDMPINDYEIIVINDGSPDNSENLVKKLQIEIPNIILINQENAGVSSARNKGIEKAIGEYLVFIDPDDYVNPNLLKRLYDRAKKDDLDILQSGRSIVNPNGQIKHMLGYEFIKNRVFTGTEAFYEKDKNFKFFDSSVGYLYKRSLIIKNEISYPVGVVHLEDGVFLRKIFTLATKVGFENCDFYQVYERPGSASRSSIGISENASIGDIRSAKYLIDFKKSNKLNPSQLGLINTSIIKYTLLPLMRAIKAKNLRLLIDYERKLEKEGLKPLKITNVPKGIYLDLAKAYNMSTVLFVLKYIVRKKIQNYKAKHQNEVFNRKRSR